MVKKQKLLFKICSRFFQLYIYQRNISFFVLDNLQSSIELSEKKLKSKQAYEHGKLYYLFPFA